jgi:predicted protein tyrosine phosphatase
MFSIFSERELGEYLSQNSLEGKACISIGDPGQAIPVGLETCHALLRLEFFDQGESEPESGRMRIPEMEDIEECIEFYKTHAKLDFVLHCDSGVSRSPAVALGLLYMKLDSEEKAKNALHEIRPRAMPNKRIVLLFDNILGSELRMVNYYIWMKRIESMKKTIREITDQG